MYICQLLKVSIDNSTKNSIFTPLYSCPSTLYLFPSNQKIDDSTGNENLTASPTANNLKQLLTVLSHVVLQLFKFHGHQQHHQCIKNIDCQSHYRHLTSGLYEILHIRQQGNLPCSRKILQNSNSFIWFGSLVYEYLV